MARRSTGRMSPPEEIRPEALRPVASPVNTYVQPSRDEVDQATARAQYLENTLAEAERPLRQAFVERVDERNKELKLQAAIDAQGEYYKWYGEVAPSLEGTDPAKVAEVWTAKFNERFGNEGDKLKSYALKELLASSIASETKQQANRRAAEVTSARYDNWTVALNGQIADARKRGASDEEVQGLIQSHFDAGKTSGLGAGELNKRLLRTQQDLLSGDDRTKWDTSILSYIKSRKLDQTQNPEYNSVLDNINARINTPTGVEKETYQIGFAREAEDLVAKGVSKKTFEQWFDKKAGEGALKFGVSDATRARYIAQIEARDKSAIEAGAKRQILEGVATNFLNTGVFVENRQPFAKADGSVGYVSETEQREYIRAAGARTFGFDSPQFIKNVATQVKVPEYEGILTAGVNALTQLNTDKEQLTFKDAQGREYTTTKSARALAASFDLISRLKAQGGDAAVAMQLPNEKSRELFESYMMLRNMGYKDQQISEMMANGRASGVVVPNELLDRKVKETLNTSFDWIPTWMGGGYDATNGAYVKEAIKTTVKSMAGYTGSTDYDTLTNEAVRRFKETHTQSPKGKHFLFIGDPMVNQKFGSAQKFGEAVDVVAERIEQDYIARQKSMGVSVPKGSVQIVPHPSRPQTYAVTYDGQNPLAGMQTITLDQLQRSYNAIQAEKANTKLKQKRDGSQMPLDMIMP